MQQGLNIRLLDNVGNCTKRLFIFDNGTRLRLHRKVAQKKTFMQKMNMLATMSFKLFDIW